MNRISELRKQQDIKQTVLADRLGITQATLSNWERGIHDPDNDTLLTLSELFNVSTDYLLGKADKLNLVTEIPEELKGKQAAFSGGAFDGLDEDDIDMLMEMAKHLRDKKERKEKGE